MDRLRTLWEFLGISFGCHSEAAAGQVLPQDFEQRTAYFGPPAQVTSR